MPGSASHPPLAAGRRANCAVDSNDHRHHCHVIATDTKKYPLAPLFGRQSAWSAEHPLDYPDMVKAMRRGRRRQGRAGAGVVGLCVRQLLCGGLGRGASGALHRRVLGRRGRARRGGEDEALDGQGPHRHAHLHLRLDPCRAGDVLRRGGRVPGLAIRQRPGPVGLHADARRGPAAAGNRDEALPEGARHPRPFRPREAADGPAAVRRPPRRCWALSRNIRTSI